ncbi:histidine kinase dimerization/phospho-acceptor domain-containing protein, partial [Corynebacterium variabile]|uniref:histidine kinase dimerization/phospho-acceptor domain-containing protein n=3 Tax=Corynebacterium TaxID=1716 RepID=UPI003F9906E8
MRSIRARVTAGATLFVAVILIVAAVIAVPVLGRVLTDSVAESVDQDLDSLESQLEAAPDRAEAVVAGIDDDLLVRLQTRDGTEVVNDGDAAELAGTDGEDATTVTVDDESWLAATEDTDAGTLTVARPMEHVDDTVSATTTLLVVTVPLMVLLVGLVVWVVTGRALRPVERLRRQVDSIGASDLSRRVDAGDDELGALAATMNRMLGRLEQSQAVQRRFVSDASHELRSPLATMRQYAELAVAHPETVPTEELGEVVVAEGERMQDLVEGLLLLARL